VGIKMLTGEVKKMLGEMTRIDADHYPETLGKTCIINAPFLFKGIWSIVKTMLAARTVSKVSVCLSSWSSCCCSKVTRSLYER
jgi:hypothetical protein